MDQYLRVGVISSTHGAVSYTNLVVPVVLVRFSEEGTPCIFHDIAESAYLNPAGAEREEDTCSDEQCQHDRPPDEAVHRTVNACDNF